MRIIAMSDIHGRFDNFQPPLLPDADLCVIAGDITTRGSRDTKEFLASTRWIARIVDRYQTTLWIPGNHDLSMSPDVYYPIGADGPNRLHSILDRRFEQNGVAFYGVALSTAYDMPELASTWAHMTIRREVEDAAFGLIPYDTDIVISHSPPYGVLDAAGYARNPDGSWEKRPIGSKALSNFIEKCGPKAVICGHVHGCAGHIRYGQTDVYNVAEEWRIISL